MDAHPQSWLWEGFSVKLDGVTNVYSCTRMLNWIRKTEEVLVAATDSNEKSLDKCFRIVRFDRADNLRGTAPTVELPGLSEFQSSLTVLAIDCFVKKENDAEINIIGSYLLSITLSKDFGAHCLLDSAVIFMNQLWEDDQHLDSETKCNINFYASSAIDDISAHPVEYYEHAVVYSPTLVTNAFLKQKDYSENVFLIPSDDGLLHVFHESSADGTFKFSEYSSEVLQLNFPEFVIETTDRSQSLSDLSALPFILWLDLHYLESDLTKRLSAIAWENGNIKLSLCDLTQPERAEILFSKTICFDGPVTQLRFFTASTVDVSSEVNLVVCTALEFVYVYHDVVKHIFDKVVPFDPSVLDSDCVLCCATYDIDMDCKNEIVIGTFYQQIAAFKYSPSKNVYELMWDRKYPGPVRALQVVDLSNDGLSDLIVVTNNSVHIMQHNTAFIAQLCKQKLLSYLLLLQNGD